MYKLYEEWKYLFMSKSHLQGLALKLKSGDTTRIIIKLDCYGSFNIFH